MTIKTLKTYKNNPIYVSIHKDRYNYIDNYYSSNVSINYNINLQLFGGLDYDIKNNIENYSNFYRSTTIKTFNKDLWNNEVYPGNSGKVLMKKSDQKYFIQNFIYNNFLIRGNGPTIDGSIAKDFTSANNLYTKFYPQSTNWAITFWIKTPQDSFTNQSYIYGNYSTNRATPQICTDANGNLLLYLASNTSSWNIADGVIVGSVELNKTYELILTFDGSKYQFIIGSNSGMTQVWNRIVTWELESTTNVYSTNSEQFCIGYDSSNQAWTGEIDLYRSNIKVNGNIYWQAYSIIGAVQEGCLDNIDDVANEKTYSTFVKTNGDFILSESDEDKEGYIWANHITIPAHTITNPYKANFDLVGSNISINNFIASGFNTSSWLTTTVQLPTSDFFAVPPKRLIARFKPSDTNTNQGIWRLMEVKGGGVHTWIGIRYYDMCIWRNGFTYGNTDIFKNKEDRYYWSQVILDSTGIKVYVIESDATMFSDLPTDLSEWQLNVNISTDISNIVKYAEIGYAATSEYWRGTIDLSSLQIDTNFNNTGWSNLWKAINFS